MSDNWILTHLCDPGVTVHGITVDNNGTVYFTACNENLYQIRQNDINTKPTILVKIEGAYLWGIVWNGNNILYICDNQYERILSYSIDTGNISIFAGTQMDGVKGHKDGNIKEAQFCRPR